MNPSTEKQIWLDRLRNLAFLRSMQVKHLFIENITVEDSKSYEAMAKGSVKHHDTLSKIMKEFSKIGNSLDRGENGLDIRKKISQEGYMWFMNMGPGIVHYLLSQKTKIPAILHPTTTRENQAQARALWEKVKAENRSGLSAEEAQTLHKQRETMAKQMIIHARTSGSLPAEEPAFLLFSKVDELQSAFSSEDSPALYKFKPDDQKTKSPAQNPSI